MTYKKQLFTVNIVRAQMLSLILFAALFLPALAVNIFAFNRPFFVLKPAWEIVLAIAVCAVGLVCHELTHALAAIVFGKQKITDIKFGADLKRGILYCHMREPMKLNAYRIVLLAPLVLTGIIPLVIVMCLGSAVLIMICSLLAAGSAGDILMLLALHKAPKNAFVLDHPSAAAYFLCYNENETPPDFHETTEEEEQAAVKAAAEFASMKNGKDSQLIKILAVLIFIAVSVLTIFVMAVVLRHF